MQQITLTQLPAQQLSFVADGDSYTLRLVKLGQAMFMDVTRNATVISTGLRCIANVALLQYSAYRGGRGDFLFQTTNGDYPDWSDFGVGTTLWYLSPTDVTSATVV